MPHVDSAPAAPLPRPPSVRFIVKVEILPNEYQAIIANQDFSVRMRVPVALAQRRLVEARSGFFWAEMTRGVLELGERYGKADPW